MDVSTSIQHRLLDAQNEFLAALNAGDDALNAFSEKWSCLREDVEQAVGRSALDQDVLSLAHSVSSRIAVLSESVAQLDQDANRITSSLLEDVEDIFAQMTLDDTIPRTFDRPTPIRTHKLERSVRASLPQYLPAAYEWLFLHLHDPYPSAILKRQLAKECHVSLRCIDDWFKSIRRRMGWVSLCKTHFKGSRSLAIVAAKRTFLEESVGADLPFEVVADFLAMKSRLQNLYIAEQGSNAHTSLPHQTRRKRQRSSSSLSVDSPIVISPSSPSYAFEDDIQLVGDLQDRSPGRPPSLVFSSSDSDEDDAGSDFVSQTPPDDKIIWSDDSTSSWDVVDKVQDNTPSSIFFARLQKAHEPGMSPTPGCSLERCLPLPVSGLDWWSSQMEANHPVVSPETLPPAPSCIPPKCRKRRRSDADGYPLPKRSRNGPAMRASRPQAVSNPFPVKQNVAQDLPVVGYENFFKDIDSILSMAPDPQPAVDLDEFVDFDAYCHTFSPEADIRPAASLSDGHGRDAHEAGLENYIDVSLDAQSSMVLKALPLPDVTATALAEIEDLLRGMPACPTAGKLQPTSSACNTGFVPQDVAAVEAPLGPDQWAEIESLLQSLDHLPPVTKCEDVSSPSIECTIDWDNLPQAILDLTSSSIAA